MPDVTLLIGQPVRVKNCLHRTFVLVSATLLLVALGIITSPAASASPSDLRGEADQVMNMKYLEFVRYKSDVHSEGFNWDSDGCSGPGAIKPVYRSLFNRPCQQHDFGYRNYGRKDGRLQLSPDEDTRAWVDARWAQEMERVCVRNFSKPWETYNLIFCRGQASSVYGAMRHSKEAKAAFY